MNCDKNVLQYLFSMYFVSYKETQAHYIILFVSSSAHAPCIHLESTNDSSWSELWGSQCCWKP